MTDGKPRVVEWKDAAACGCGEGRRGGCGGAVGGGGGQGGEGRGDRWERIRGHVAEWLRSCGIPNRLSKSQTSKYSRQVCVTLDFEILILRTGKPNHVRYLNSYPRNPVPMQCQTPISQPYAVILLRLKPQPREPQHSTFDPESSAPINPSYRDSQAACRQHSQPICDTLEANMLTP